MLCLPALSSGDAVWRIPLARISERPLQDALLLDDDKRQAERLEAIMRDDPALTMWAVCRLAEDDAGQFRTLSELAQRLSDRALEVLDWGDEEPRVPSPALALRLERLAASGLKIALAASRHATNEEIRQQAFLLGSLHNSHEVLAACCCERGDEAAATSTCLPGWLAGSIDRIATGTPESPPERLVVAALVDCSVEQQIDDCESHCVPETSAEARVGSLPVLVNKLARLKQVEEQFAETLLQEKLASLKELAYGASHEINNPLANISTRAQTMLRDETDPQRRRKLATIHSQAMRAHEMISSMMLFAKPPRLDPRQLDLTELMEEVIGEITFQAELQGTAIQRRFPSTPVSIVADGNHLAVAIKALLENSLQAIGAGGTIGIEIACDTKDVGLAEATGKNRDVKIVVRDTGPGIEETQRAHMFDPFYSGREAGRGLGFGLSKCWRIVTQHGGRIEVAERPDCGAEFTLYLPGRSSAEGSAAAA